MSDPKEPDNVERLRQIERRNEGVPEQTGDLADVQEVESVTPPTWGPGMWWRIGIGALAVLIVALILVRIL